MGVSKNSGLPKSSHFHRVFHYKPSILGYPYFLETPICTSRFYPLKRGFFSQRHFMALLFQYEKNKSQTSKKDQHVFFQSGNWIHIMFKTQVVSCAKKVKKYLAAHRQGHRVNQPFIQDMVVFWPPQKKTVAMCS